MSDFSGEKSGKFLFLKQTITKLKPFFIIAVFYFILQKSGISCPIKFLTGISCAGCGMTRAWTALLHLDFKTAFYYHPLFLLPFVFLIIYIFKEQINKKIFNILIFTICALFVIVYIYRLFDGDNQIVTIEIQNGLFYKIISIFLNQGGN